MTGHQLYGVLRESLPMGCKPAAQWLESIVLPAATDEALAFFHQLVKHRTWSPMTSGG